MYLLILLNNRYASCKIHIIHKSIFILSSAFANPFCSSPVGLTLCISQSQLLLRNYYFSYPWKCKQHRHNIWQRITFPILRSFSFHLSPHYTSFHSEVAGKRRPLADRKLPNEGKERVREPKGGLVPHHMPFISLTLGPQPMIHFQSSPFLQLPWLLDPRPLALGIISFPLLSFPPEVPKARRTEVEVETVRIALFIDNLGSLTLFVATSVFFTLRSRPKLSMIREVISILLSFTPRRGSSGRHGRRAGCEYMMIRQGSTLLWYISSLFVHEWRTTRLREA